MQDKRKSEVDYIINVCKALIQLHPNLFTLETYLHPIYGEKTAFRLLKENKSVDVENILLIEFQFTDNNIFIQTEFPNMVYRYNNIIKDETVV